MKRIFSDYAYGPGPRDGCWWDTTADIAAHPSLRGEISCDVAIVGGGFTGMSAAFHLARSGVSVAVLEANEIGWGASGRNGGFCCLGGSMAPDATLDRRFGKSARLEWRGAERAAVELVDQLITDQGWDVDRHSAGETCLAHRPRDSAGFEGEAETILENYGLTPEVLNADQLAQRGMGGPFHGALTTPIGFGLNPRKYLAGLLGAATSASAQVFDHSPVVEITKHGVKTQQGFVSAQRVILATNGYSSEDVPTGLAGRYMPAQSTVLVTRPLSDTELANQGWTSDQMAYDTRKLLHYFRLMPDRRFLFGMRGGLFSSRVAEQRARAKVLRDFHRIFPAWAEVEITHSWSGMVCLARDRVPFVGPIPNAPHILAGFAYHGNGVAMGTFVGQTLAALACGKTPSYYPKVVQGPTRRFPFGMSRRAIMPPVYAAFQMQDVWR